MTEQERQAALCALNRLAMACDPSNETMGLVRAIRDALSSPLSCTEKPGNVCVSESYAQEGAPSSPRVEVIDYDIIDHVITEVFGTGDQFEMIDRGNLQAFAARAYAELQKGHVS